MESRLNSWQVDNARKTREYCEGLLTVLKGNHLDPILQRLKGKEAAKVSFKDVIDGYNKIKDDYENSAKGSKDVIAAVFLEFHPVRNIFFNVFFLGGRGGGRERQPLLTARLLII